MAAILVITAAGVCAARTANAASLNLASDTSATGVASTPRCASGTLSVTPVLSGLNVASVVVSGIPASCAGATLSVTANNGSTFSSGSAVVLAGGGSLGVTLAISVAVTSGMQIEALMTG